MAQECLHILHVELNPVLRQKHALALHQCQDSQQQSDLSTTTRMLWFERKE